MRRNGPPPLLDRGRGIEISVGVLGFTFDDEKTAGAAFPGTGSEVVKADLVRMEIVC